VLQEFSAAGAHRGRANGGELFEQRENLRAQGCILACKIGEGLHGKRFHDAAAIAEVIEHDIHGNGTLPGCEFQARNHQRKVPTDFLLIALAGDRQESCLEWLKKFGALRRYFLEGIGGAHAQDRVIAGQSFKNMAKKGRPGKHLRDNFIRPAD
jgi:hypothetical protein